MEYQFKKIENGAGIYILRKIFRMILNVDAGAAHVENDFNIEFLRRQKFTKSTGNIIRNKN
jgi:hypothetical protein